MYDGSAVRSFQAPGRERTSITDIIRVGFVGAGENSVRHHIPNLLAIDEVSLVAVANRTSESSRRVAESFDIPTIYEDWRDLVADPGVDAVVIGTWPNMHHPVTLAAHQAGKHVLCEARMAMNSREAEEMLDSANAHSELVSHLVPAPLTLGVDDSVIRLIRGGFAGGLVLIDVTHRTGDFSDPSARLHWRQDERLSGNNILTLGIWYESIMRWAGVAREVTAVGKVVVDTREDELGPHEVVIPDHLDVIATMEMGAQLRMQMSSVTGMSNHIGATIFGTEGTIHFDGTNLSVGRRGDQELQPFEIPEGEGRGWRVEEDFIAAIRGEGEPAFTDFETGVKYMEFTDAVWRSMEDKVTVSLPLGRTGDLG